MMKFQTMIHYCEKTNAAVPRVEEACVLAVDDSLLDCIYPCSRIAQESTMGRDKAVLGFVHVLHVLSSHQYANIFTNGLPTSLFQDLNSSLSIRLPPAPTAGAC